MTMTATPNSQPTPQPVGLRAAPTESVALAKRAPDSSFCLALEPDTFEQAFALAKMISDSGMWAPKDAKCLTPQQVMMRLLTGRNLGVPAVIAMQHIYDLYGRTGISAALKQALVVRHPDCEVFQHVESDDTHATYKIKRRGNPEQLFTFHIKEAARAKLLKPDSNYEKWPKRMCQARARAEACDVWFPDATMGLPTIDDLEDEMVGEVVLPGEAPATTLPAAAVAARDWAAETARLKANIADAVGGDLTTKKALREMVARFLAEAPDTVSDELKAFYNTTIANGGATANGAAVPSTATAPAAVPPPPRSDPGLAANTAAAAKAARAARETAPRGRGPYVAPRDRGDAYEGPEEPEPPFGSGT